MATIHMFERSRFKDHETEHLFTSHPTYYHDSHSRESIVLATQYQRLEFDPNQSWQNLTSQNLLSEKFGIGQYMTDTSTPLWKSEKRKRIVRVNPMTNTRLATNGTFGWFDARYWPKSERVPINGLYGKRLYAPFNSLGSDFSYEVGIAHKRYANGQATEFENLALLSNEAYGSILEKQAAFLVTLAELEKTAETLSGLYKDAMKILRRLRSVLRGKSSSFWQKPVEVGDVSRFVSQRWLQYRYGLRPIMYEISDILHAMQHQYNTVGGTRRQETLLSSLPSTSGSTPYRPLFMNGTDTCIRLTADTDTSYQTVNRTGHVYVAEPSRFKATRRWGVDDLLGTAYEITPYSWILDWFIDMSGYIQRVTQQITGDSYFELRASWASVRTDTTTLTAVRPTWDYVELWTYYLGDTRLALTLDAGDSNFPTDPSELEARVRKYLNLELNYVQSTRTERLMRYIREPYEFTPDLTVLPKTHGFERFLKSLPKMLDVGSLLRLKGEFNDSRHIYRL